ncbi:MAG TPA: pyruvate kinase [Spirochaetota bacterium]|nr:pyruvate kinase [Spirochaetota bacterium]HPG49059.1 pyruvate kinase [Spirochaetota bacterium]HPN11874.1 pyruvate kinase [Spirochaetota bacterium]
MRKTKIICTLGPATDSGDVLRLLFMNGMNVGRLNFSHGSHEEHKKRIEQFKKLRDEIGYPAGLLLDTKGPEIRIGQFENTEVELQPGSSFTFTTRMIQGTVKEVSVAYAGFPGIVKKGAVILLDDGLIAMKVLEAGPEEVTCEVINGGILSNNKKINIPGMANKLPFMTDKDREDLLFGIENDFDFIAASFVRNAVDIKDLREEVRKHGGENIKIISKIEIREGVENIDEIISISDGIMIARGDMGVEIPFEELPAIQKMIIKKCYNAGKPVITATQMLDSMIRNPRPTRAEITDVANAIYDGTSAIMLSGETSIGKFPVESLLTMSKIAIETERDIDYIHRFDESRTPVSRNVTNAVSRAACETAHILGAAAIVSVTKSGHTANMVSRYRPACPILATTASRKVFNQLSLSWGVYPDMTERKNSTDEVFKQAVAKAAESSMIKSGDLVVITGGMIADVSGTTNMIKVHIVGDVLLEGKGGAPYRTSGSVCVIQTPADLIHFNVGEVIVIRNTSDEVLSVLRNAAAVVTEEPERESQAVIAARALGIPAVSDAENATEILKSGTVVTVDGKKGVIYSGIKK